MAETSGNGGVLRLSYGVALTPAAAASGGRQEPRALELVAQCGVVPVLVRTHAFEGEDQQRVRVFVGNLSSVSGSTLADFALHGAAILRHGGVAFYDEASASPFTSALRTRTSSASRSCGRTRFVCADAISLFCVREEASRV